MAAPAGQPRFSVVLNTYNRAHLLPRSMGSVLDQDHRDYELIVVDDGSTDDTREVVARHSTAAVRYIHRANGGLAAARNTGLDAAGGEYVAFLDDDDRVKPGWLGAFHRRIEADGAAVVSCGARFVDDRGRTVEQRLPAPLGPAFSNQTGLFMAGSFVIRRDVLEAVGGYAEQLRCSEQTELSLRVLPYVVDRGLRVSTVAEANVVYNRSDDADRPLRRPDFLHSGALMVLDRHGDRLARDPALFADFKAVAGVQAARLGDYRQARRLLKDALVANPRRLKHGARLLLATVPPLGRKVWPAWQAPSPSPVGAR